MYNSRERERRHLIYDRRERKDIQCFIVEREKNIQCITVDRETRQSMYNRTEKSSNV